MVLPFLGCETDSDIDGHAEKLTLISDHELNIVGPSGLTLDSSGNFLWTVSDQSAGTIYKIAFDGGIIGALGYRGDDMEGITMNPNDGTIWVVEESLRQLVQLDSQGRVKQRVEVPGQIVNVNDGLEGVAIDPITEHFYLVNEKMPAEFIELDEKFEVVRRIRINFRSEFRMDDLSGIFYVNDENENREFWVLSDESRRILVTDFEFNPLRAYDLDKNKFEGIAVDVRAGRVYLVNDEENRLYVYSYR
mgnify:CR=1 FL=1